jgi:hypothetical protein
LVYLTKTKKKDVPVIVCGGIAKRFMVPGVKIDFRQQKLCVFLKNGFCFLEGWRVGWLVLCDRNGQFKSGKGQYFQILFWK